MSGRRRAPERTQLHVAALPFPTPQGTQAVIRTMLESVSADGSNAHLLTYGDGPGPRPSTYTWHGARRAPGASDLRSGPSLRKLAGDAALAAAVRKLDRRLRPRAVVAHHVEAAAACLAARARPMVFFAHTALGPELPTYIPHPPRVLRRALGLGGDALDRWLCRRADAVAAISPALAAALEDISGRAVVYVPPPWPVPAPLAPGERGRARQELRRDIGLDVGPEDEVMLYAGNLDRYQGLDLALRAAARVRRARGSAKMVIATASDTSQLVQDVGDLVLITRLPENEEGRRRLHAAADVAVIPRQAPGGLPIKLLDALARGLPVVAPARAAAGLALDGAAALAANDDPEALAAAIGVVLGSPRAGAEMGERGRLFITDNHSPEHFRAALGRALDEAEGSS